METITFVILSLIFMLFALFSKKINHSILTAPIVFVLFGIILGPSFLNILPLYLDLKLMRIIAELTLVLVLFTDASRIHLSSIIKDHNIPIRLLSIGLILTIIFGAFLAHLIFDYLLLWEAIIIGIILAPTDAALAQIMITAKGVPHRITQALNIESGLNDGLVLPILIVFLSFSNLLDNTQNVSNWLVLLLQQILFGTFIGWITGYVGGNLYTLGHKRNWMNHTFSEISTIALALFAYSFAHLIGGNGFISAFIAGITIGNTARKICMPIHEFAAVEGQLISLLLFFLFGVVYVGPLLHYITWPIILYALCSLTIVRMIPVAIGLLGIHLKWETLLYLGWFGPRGIASIVFGLMVLENTLIESRNEIFDVIATTVLFSIFIHGLTATFGARWYHKKTRKEKNIMEHKKVSKLPLRYPRNNHH